MQKGYDSQIIAKFSIINIRMHFLYPSYYQTRLPHRKFERVARSWAVRKLASAAMQRPERLVITGCRGSHNSNQQ